ncbi:site-2 protease family protein [Clostridium sp. 'White wine YQ']|uniref:site-2 protease family protein n=1 Tax=Clostridium sp. 'White wine YQ' TaxID=3027474 RepID=UPI0023672968|nr:site-2 protease family protein [Clostridium sp. 'White wine YQ']MDD7794877.1 site-2 protease family protein [Clostridium sp. 'White wine YQ']
MKRRKIMLLGELLILICLCLQYNFFIAFIFVLLHEISHGVMAIIFGMNIKKLLIHPLGFFIEIEDMDELTEEKQIIVYLAGPLTNLLIAIIIYICSGYYFSNMSVINLVLCFFNLLPAYPLDGGKIFNIILSKRLTYRLASKVIIYLGIIISIGFFGLFIYDILKLHKLNITLVLVSALMLYSALKEKKRIMYILMGDLVRKKSRFVKKSYIENSSISVYYKLGLVNILTLVDKNKFNCFYVLDEDMKMVGIINEDELMEALKKYGNITLEEYFSDVKE